MHVKLNTDGERQLIVTKPEFVKLDKGITILTYIVKLAGSPEQVAYAAECLSRAVAIRTAIDEGTPLPTDLRLATPRTDDEPKETE